VDGRDAELADAARIGSLDARADDADVQRSSAPRVDLPGPVALGQGCSAAGTLRDIGVRIVTDTIWPLELHTVTRTSPLTAALKDGRVVPEGFTLRFEEVDPVTKAFRLMSRELAYDVTEMAATTYLVARAHGKPFTALPVFLARGFHHSALLARESGDPKALEGTRVALNRGYTVTTGVWARGILASEYGVDLQRITWVRSDGEHVAEFEPPPNVEDMADGEKATDFDAVVGDVDHSAFVPLIADAEQAAQRYLCARANWPINHLVVVKDELLAAHPELASALVDAFARAKQLYLDSGDLHPAHARAAEVMGDDPLPYGVEANRSILDELIDHAVAQKIVRERPTVESLFAPV
jgi:4,5-dihydroxyphthalate decarboxylase